MSSDEFNVVRNVTESFSVTLPSGFVEVTGPVARTGTTISMVATPSLGKGSSSTSTTGLTLTMVATPTVVTAGPSDYTYEDEGGVHWSNSDDFYTGGSYYCTCSEKKLYSNWIPFIIADIGQGVAIASATLIVYSGGWCELSPEDVRKITNFKIGCEAVDGSVTPTTYNQANIKVMTGNYRTVSIAPATAYPYGTLYQYDITSAVQEVIDRPGWHAGHTLGVLVFDNGSLNYSGVKWQSHPHPQLYITFTP